MVADNHGSAPAAFARSTTSFIVTSILIMVDELSRPSSHDLSLSILNHESIIQRSFLLRFNFHQRQLSYGNVV